MNNRRKKAGVCGADGQTFLEFVLLLFVLVSLSLFLFKGIHGHIGERWKKLITLIASPSDSAIELP